MLLIDFFDRKVILVPPAVLVNGKHAPRFLRRGDHFLKLRRVHGDRLFAHHVFSGTQAGNHELLMKIVGRGDRDKVDLPVRKKLLQLFRRER